MDIKCLKEAGLTEGEIKVYLALLELGSSTTGPLVEKAKVARSIIYHLLESLMEKGLVSCILKEKTRHFQAAQPKKVLEYIDERQERLMQNREKVEALLPSLLLKQKMVQKSEATFYIGLKGLRTANEHLYDKLQRGEEYYCIGIPAFQPEEQHVYWKRDHLRRIRAGIKCKLLFNQDADPEVLANRNSFKGVEARYMPTDIKTPAYFLIYKDVTLIILQSPAATTVEIINQEISDTFKAYFEEFWKQSMPFRP